MGHQPVLVVLCMTFPLLMARGELPGHGAQQARDEHLSSRLGRIIRLVYKPIPPKGKFSADHALQCPRRVLRRLVLCSLPLATICTTHREALLQDKRMAAKK